jgi:periplasmic divalent cation tolerance protein
MHALVLVTCPDGKIAEAITDVVLKGRLAACVNTVKGVSSKYWWKGKIERCDEVLLIIKTRKGLVRKIEEAVKDNHPYDVPEVIAIPIDSGSKEYLGWIDSETG